MNKAVDHSDSKKPDGSDPSIGRGDPRRPASYPGPSSTPSRRQGAHVGRQNPAEPETTAPARNGWRQLLLNRGDQAFVAVAVSAMLVLMLVHWLRLSGWGLEPVEIDRLEPLEHTFRVDVNRASWVEWSQIEGVGQVLARKIVADREQRGPFRSIDDVQRVKGIGPKKLEQLRPWLTIDPSMIDKE